MPQAMLDIHEFARQMACDAKVLEEDEKTGEKKERHVGTGAEDYTMAVT